MIVLDVDDEDTRGSWLKSGILIMPAFVPFDFGNDACLSSVLESTTK